MLVHHRLGSVSTVEGQALPRRRPTRFLRFLISLNFVRSIRCSCSWAPVLAMPPRRYSICGPLRRPSSPPPHRRHFGSDPFQAGFAPRMILRTMPRPARVGSEFVLFEPLSPAHREPEHVLCCDGQRAFRYVFSFGRFPPPAGVRHVLHRLLAQAHPPAPARSSLRCALRLRWLQL